MPIKKLNLVYFSPTQSTKKIVQALAISMSLHVPSQHMSLTNVHEREKDYIFGSDELVVVAVPTYGGRVPQVLPALFENFKGNNTPVVLVVSYGNQGFGDTLLELKNILDEKGFFCVAAAAFVSQHAASKKIATGRPNADDMKKVASFGKLVHEKLNNEDLKNLATHVPGDFPYKPLPPKSPIAPMTSDKCIHCMLCFRWCPTNAIAEHNPKSTDENKCIRCQGCVRRCPVEAREIINETFTERVLKLEEMLEGVVCEPEFFI